MLDATSINRCADGGSKYGAKVYKLKANTLEAAGYGRVDGHAAAYNLGAPADNRLDRGPERSRKIDMLAPAGGDKCARRYSTFDKLLASARHRRAGGRPPGKHVLAAATNCGSRDATAAHDLQSSASLDHIVRRRGYSR